MLSDAVRSAILAEKTQAQLETERTDAVNNLLAARKEAAAPENISLEGVSATLQTQIAELEEWIADLDSLITEKSGSTPNPDSAPSINFSTRSTTT